MDIKFADSFAESLKKLRAGHRWYNQVLTWLRYDMPNFIKNIWLFKKALWNHHWWDHHGSLVFLRISLLNMATNLETKGNEDSVPRLKKVVAIRRAAELIDNYNNDRYLELAEAELGQIISRGSLDFRPCEDHPGYFELVDHLTPADNRHNRKIYNRASQLANTQWKELWQILEGQNIKDYSRKLSKLSTVEKSSDTGIWQEWFNGSGMKGWWD